MRLAITRTGFYNADYYCADSRSAKKLLREKSISILAIDYYLVGREDGCDVLLWAEQNRVLPSYVVVIERARDKRQHLVQSLINLGYRSNDDVNFVKAH